MHTAPFWHGADMHSFDSMSQRNPSHPKLKKKHVYNNKMDLGERIRVPG